MLYPIVGMTLLIVVLQAPPAAHLPILPSLREMERQQPHCRLIVEAVLWWTNS
jgi:hypothetical protein